MDRLLERVGGMKYFVFETVLRRSDSVRNEFEINSNL